MALFFKKKQREDLKMEGKESVFESEEIIQESTVDPEQQEIHTEISFAPSWNLAKEDVYAFQYLNIECPPLKPNQLSLYGISVVKQEDNFAFTAFIRHSLSKIVKLGETTIVLLGENDQILGRKVFDLSEVGELPPTSSRPWTFVYTPKDILVKEIPQEGWRLAFQITPKSQKHLLDLEDSWEKSLSSKDKTKLEDMVNHLDAPKPGEVNFIGIQAKFIDDGSFHVTLLIRNGSEETISLEQIPLIVEDATGDVVAKSGFKLDHLQVKGNTSKPWTFVFPKSMILKHGADLSRWKVYPPKN